MKRDVICQICNQSVGKFHNSQSARPLRDHIYLVHPSEFKEIVCLVEEIEARYEILSAYGINHWTQIYYNNRVKQELEFEEYQKNLPPMTDEQREKMLKSILEEE